MTEFVSVAELACCHDCPLFHFWMSGSGKRGCLLGVGAHRGRVLSAIGASRPLTTPAYHDRRLYSTAAIR